MACEHTDMIRIEHDAHTTAPGCETCIAEGGQWLHLRICLTCGYVGCCDSSPNQHASKHAYGQQHPIAGSAEQGEHWRWCYIDQQLVP